MNNSKHISRLYLFTFSLREVSRGINQLVIHSSKIAQLWLYKSRQRRELLRLTDHQLEDLGISREQANHEATKAFWK